MLRLHPDELLDRATLVEQHHGRDAADAEVAGRRRLLVGVEFGEGEAARAIIGDALEHRHQRPAGAAPWRPEIDQHGARAGALDDGRGKIRVGDDHLPGSVGHGCLTCAGTEFSAVRCVPASETVRYTRAAAATVRDACQCE